MQYMTMLAYYQVEHSLHTTNTAPVYAQTVDKCCQDCHVHEMWKWTTVAKESQDAPCILLNIAKLLKNVENFTARTDIIITTALVTCPRCNNQKQTRQLCNGYIFPDARSAEMT